jgi:hypothetical protein
MKNRKTGKRSTFPAYWGYDVRVAKALDPCPTVAAQVRLKTGTGLGSG